MYNKIRSRDDHDYLATVKTLPTFKEKLSYTWSYFTIQIVVVAVVLAIGISMGVSIYQNSAPVYISGFGVNVFSNYNSEDYREDYFKQEFLQKVLGLEEKDRTRVLYSGDRTLYVDPATGQTDMDGGSTLTFMDVRYAAKEVDFLLFTPELADVFVSRTEGITDLRQILSEEELERYADRLCYTKDNVPVGIDISDSELVRQMALVASGPIQIGFCAYGEHFDHAKPFLDFIMENCGK